METKAEKPRLKMVGALLCDTCPHREECDEEFKENCLTIQIIESTEVSGDCFGGYYCLGIPKNSIPFDQGSDSYCRYQYETIHDKSKQSLKLPNFPKLEEDFILINDES